MMRGVPRILRVHPRHRRPHALPSSSTARATTRLSPGTRAAETGRAVDGVRRIVRGLRLAEQRTRADAGLSAAQLFVLGALAESAATSLSALATLTHTDRSSVASVVERLEEAGLVVSERAAEDRRRVLVRITTAGRRKMQAAPEPPTALLLAGLARLTRTELAGLSAGLERLVEEMGLADEPAGMLFEERAPARKARKGTDNATRG